jgi:general secretion pathway protein J
MRRERGLNRSSQGARPPCRSPIPDRRLRGLTLVELLVAVAIFGILSAFAYRALTVVLDSRGRIEQENRKWRGLALFFARLEQDVATAVPRPVRDPGDLLSPALAGSATGVRINEGALMLTRTAAAPEPGALEAPRRLGYRLRGTVVELLTWSVLDQGPRTEPRVVAVLDGVKALDLRYLDARGQWYLAWPPPLAAAAPAALPVAVEVRLELVSGERIVRLLPTAARTRQ